MGRRSVVGNAGGCLDLFGQESPLPICGCEVTCLPESFCRRFHRSEPAQICSANRVEPVVVVQVHRHLLDELQGWHRTVDLRNGDRSVERDHRRRSHGVQVVVEGDDLAPICLFE